MRSMTSIGRTRSNSTPSRRIPSFAGHRLKKYGILSLISSSSVGQMASRMTARTRGSSAASRATADEPTENPSAAIFTPEPAFCVAKSIAARKSRCS